MQHLIPLYLLACLLLGTVAMVLLAIHVRRAKNRALLFFSLAFACFGVGVLRNLLLSYLGINLQRGLSPLAYGVLAAGFPFSFLMQACIALAADELAKPPFKRASDVVACSVAGLELVLSLTPLFAQYLPGERRVALGPLFGAMNGSIIAYMAYAASVLVAYRKRIEGIRARKLLVAFAGLSAAFIPALAIDEFRFSGSASIAEVPLGFIVSPLYFAVVSAGVIAVGIRALAATGRSAVEGPETPPDAERRGDADISATLESLRAVSFERIAAAAGLSARELETARLLVRGLPDKAIAAELGISPRTVGNHVSSIFRKSGVGSRFELAAALDQAAPVAVRSVPAVPKGSPIPPIPPSR